MGAMGSPNDMQAAAIDAINAAPAIDAAAAQEFVAPMRLQTESYESFRRLLPGAVQDEKVREGVAEELRQLGIDPELFYSSSARVGVCDLDPDDLDPTSSVAPPVSAPNPGLTAGIAAAAAAVAAISMNI